MQRALMLILLALGAPPMAASCGEPANRSRIAFTVWERDLLPENVAHDPATGTFYLGSTRHGKILRVLDGTATEFVGPQAHGLWMVIGMKVDPVHRVLWVVSSGGDNLIGYAREGDRPAGLFRFDLADGALTGRWLLDVPGETHFLNDLVITPDGDVLVTHMFERGQIWRLDATTGTFAPLYRGDPLFTYPNGLTLSDDASALFVAHREGISRIGLESRERRLLTAPTNVEVSGIDGLYLHRGHLIGIRPDAHEVLRYRLSTAADALAEVEVLEAQHPLFGDPTTGVLVGDELFYVANSQFERVVDGALPPWAELLEPVVLRLSLAPSERISGGAGLMPLAEIQW